jgi:hypothetical protein
MRYKATFIAGLAVGFIAGARSGRETYDQLVRLGRQVAGHPKVQQAANTVQQKATTLAKTAAAKAPDYAKTAAATAAKTASEQAAQVPRLVSTAKQAAASKLPGKLGGSNTPDGGPDDGAIDAERGDVAADGNLIYPAEGSSSVNGSHFTDKP